mmetsp:Transcript_59081/g.101746  ORF Transcript_59081/g.101746 Transcript_59081/m.101746 type:complete len:153 (-) Transcript_59081:144-602(-)
MSEGTNEMEYDIKYTGFPEEEAYEYGKPVTEVASPEEFEGSEEEEEEEEEEDDEDEPEEEKRFRRTSIHSSADDLHEIQEENSEDAYDEDEDDLSRLLAEFDLGSEFYEPIADACGGSTYADIVSAGERNIAKAGVSMLKVRKLFKEAKARA